MAEEKCNSTVAGPQSPVEQSKKTNAHIKGLLDSSQEKILRDLAARNKSINELQGKARDLNKKVHHLANKVSDSLSFCIH